MSASSAHIFPKAEADQLKNEQNYYVWSVHMKNVFETCDMWGVVNGSETIPADDTVHAAKRRIWIKKDNLAKAMITQCIKTDLVIKVAHAMCQGIMGHISIRIQPDQLRVDYALVSMSHQATPLRRRCLHSHHELSGSYLLPHKR